MCLYSQSQTHNPVHRGSSISIGSVSERERQLKLAKASSPAVRSSLASAPVLWIQWLSSGYQSEDIKFDSQLDPAGFLSLSKVYVKLAVQFYSLLYIQTVLA